VSGKVSRRKGRKRERLRRLGGKCSPLPFKERRESLEKGIRLEKDPRGRGRPKKRKTSRDQINSLKGKKKKERATSRAERGPQTEKKGGGPHRRGKKKDDGIPTEEKVRIWGKKEIAEAKKKTTVQNRLSKGRLPARALQKEEHTPSENQAIFFKKNGPSTLVRQRKEELGGTERGEKCASDPEEHRRKG